MCLMSKRIKSLNKMRDMLRKKSNKSDFDLVYLKSMEFYKEMAKKALTTLEESDYYNLCAKAEEEKKISLRVMLRKKKNPPCRQPQEREWQTGSATGYYPMKGSRQAALRLSIFLKSGLPFENIPSLPPCNKQGLSTRIFSYNTPPLLGLLFCK